MTEREIFDHMPPGEKVAYLICHFIPALTFLGVLVYAVISIAQG